MNRHVPLASTLAAFGLLLSGCGRKTSNPIPLIDLTIEPPPGIYIPGALYWVYPPHANISVFLNALFNSAGPDGVCVYLMEAHYTVYSPIKLPAHGCLIGVPMVFYDVAPNHDEPMIEVQP